MPSTASSTPPALPSHSADLCFLSQNCLIRSLSSFSCSAARLIVYPGRWLTHRGLYLGARPCACMQCHWVISCQWIPQRHDDDDGDFFFVHSCSDGVNDIKTQSPALVGDRAAAGSDPMPTGLPPVGSRTELQNCELLLKKRHSQLRNYKCLMPLTRCVLVFAPLIPLSALAKLASHQWSLSRLLPPRL